jgi:hypothetical protein
MVCGRDLDIPGDIASPGLDGKSADWQGERGVRWR